MADKYWWLGLYPQAREQQLVAEVERLRQQLELQSSQLAERQQLVGHLQVCDSFLFVMLCTLLVGSFVNRLSLFHILQHTHTHTFWYTRALQTTKRYNAYMICHSLLSDKSCRRPTWFLTWVTTGVATGPLWVRAANLFCGPTQKIVIKTFQHKKEEKTEQEKMWEHFC